MENNRECYHCSGHPELLRTFFQFFAHAESDVRPRQKEYYQRYRRISGEMHDIWEAHGLPWARQAQGLATAGAGPCSIIGTSVKAPAVDAVFANSVAGHGLVREDMHTGSVSHLGIVVLPPLLALAQQRRVDGRSFAAAAIVGYEVGGRIGRAIVTPEAWRAITAWPFTMRSSSSPRGMRDARRSTARICSTAGDSAT